MALVGAAGFGWTCPYPFVGTHGAWGLPRFDDATADKITDAMERLIIGEKIPQTSYLHLCLNAYNCRNNVRVLNGVWAYIHPVRKVLPAGNRPTPIWIGKPRTMQSDRAEADLTTPWVPMVIPPIAPGVFAPFNPPAIRTLPNEPRYRLAIFPHQHIVSTTQSVFSMTVWDRQANTLMWLDTGVEGRASRKADILHYWNQIAAPDFQLPPLDTTTTDNIFPHTDIFDRVRTDYNPNHTLYQILAWCIWYMDNVDIPVIGPPPFDNVEMQSGMAHPYIPRLLAHLFRMMQCDRFGLPGDYETLATVEARFRIANVGKRKFLQRQLQESFTEHTAWYPMEFQIDPLFATTIAA